MDFAEGKEKSGLAEMLNNRTDAPSELHYQFIPKGSGFIHDLMDGSLKLEELTHDANTNEIEAVVATVEPGVSCWERKMCSGGKWYFILEGKLEILVNDVSYILDEGDSIYLGPIDSHIWRNAAEDTAKVLMFCSPPSQ